MIFWSRPVCHKGGAVVRVSLELGCTHPSTAPSSPFNVFFRHLIVCIYVCLCVCEQTQEPFDAQSFVSRLLGFGDIKGLVQQLRESQEGAGDPKEMM